MRTFITTPPGLTVPKKICGLSPRRCLVLAAVTAFLCYFFYVSWECKAEGPITENCKPSWETASFVVGLELEVQTVEEAISAFVRWRLRRKLENAAISRVHSALHHAHKHKEKSLSHQHELVPHFAVGKPVAMVLEELFSFTCVKDDNFAEPDEVTSSIIN